MTPTSGESPIDLAARRAVIERLDGEMPPATTGLRVLGSYPAADAAA